MCLPSLIQGGKDVSLIPEELYTKDICYYMFEASVYNIQYIPEKFVTERMLTYIASRHPSLFCKVDFPKRLRTKEYIEKLINIPSFSYSSKQIKGYLEEAHITPLD